MEFIIIDEGSKEESKEESRGSDFRGVLAVDDAGDAWIMASTNDCKAANLFENGNLFADNGGNYEGTLNVGLYSVRFRPWSYKSYEGEYDVGVDAVDIQLIAPAPSEFLMEESK